MFKFDNYLAIFHLFISKKALNFKKDSTKSVISVKCQYLMAQKTYQI